MKATYSRAVTSHRAVLALTACSIAMVAGPAAAQAKTETDTDGIVKASFS
jgi:hypothetical protein